MAATQEAARICAGRSTRFQIPYLDFQGTPLGVDVRKVVESGLTPRINTGIAHAPLACFHAALLALDAAG